MKSDVLQIYYDKHGTKLRDRLIRDSSLVSSRFSGLLSPLINSVQRTQWFRAMLEKIAGFDSRRILPGYAREPFYKWFEKKRNNFTNPEKRVVLFADTYLNFHEPNVGIGALELLNSCGYEVILANVGCCQRPRISHGFLRDAKTDGTKTAEGLRKFIDDGLKIVVCEPSCASALNDDLPDLIDDESLATSLRNNVVMIDKFLENEISSGRLSVELESIAGNILIHGHCHQKSLYGTEGMSRLLNNGSYTVAEIPSGCCGMAGSFGYEAEHYAISQKIGDSILFPAVKSIKENTTVVANGFSCRHQIHHFTGVMPRHWVEVIRAKH